MLLVVAAGEIWQRLRIAFCAIERRHAKRQESFGGDNPWRNGCRKILGEKWAERLILPRLNVASGPVVHQAESKGATFRFVDGDRVTEFVAVADDYPDFQFVVEPLAGAEGWFLGV